MFNSRSDPVDNGQDKSGFSCCRLKKHSYRVCVRCHKIYHRSCLDRRPFVHLRDYLVECCQTNTQLMSLEELTGDSESEVVASLRQVIDGLGNDLRDREKFIYKLRCEKDLLLNEAESLERQLVDENSELKKTVAELSKRIFDQDSRDASKELISSSTQTFPISVATTRDSCCQIGPRVRDAETTTQDILTDGANGTDFRGLEEKMLHSIERLSELEQLREEMLTTIQTLGHDNQFLSAELEKLRQIPSSLAPSVTMDTSLDTDSCHMEDAASSLFDELSVADPCMARNSSGLQIHEPLSATSEDWPVRGLKYFPLDPSRKQVLVFGDGTAKGVATGLLNFASSREYFIQGESHPGYSVSKMGDRIFQLTADFGCQDSVVVCIDLDSASSISPHHLNKLFSVGRYTNVIFSLTYSNLKKDRYIYFVSLCSMFLKRQNASIRNFSNNFVDGKFRLSKRCLYKNLYNYVVSSYVLKNVFVLSYLKCHNAVNSDVADCQRLLGQNDEGENGKRGSFLG